MSVTPLSSSGRLPDALVNSGNVTHLKQNPQSQEAPSGPVKFCDDQKIKQLEEEATRAFREGRYTDITDKLVPQGGGASYDRYEGKTIVENEAPGLIIGSTFTEDGQPVLDPGYGETRARHGAPDHAFFYHNTDFLSDAATEYAKLGENEVFRYRNINDVNFVRDTLNFFTGGNYTDGDVNHMQAQMTDVVRELAQQIKNGETADLSKVQSKLTIGGEDVTISQILDFQKAGAEFKEAFDSIGVGQLDTQAYGKMGMAKAMADYYGSDKGEIGAMFSKAMDQLYEKGVAQTERLIAHVSSGSSGYLHAMTERERDAIQTATDIRDTFSKLDISSKENLVKDFSSRLSAVRAMVQSHCNQFNISASHVSLDSDTASIMKQFNAWLNQA